MEREEKEETAKATGKEYKAKGLPVAGRWTIKDEENIYKPE